MKFGFLTDTRVPEIFNALQALSIKIQIDFSAKRGQKIRLAETAYQMKEVKMPK